MSEPTDLIDRIRLIRTQGIGPIAYRQLLMRFGSAGAAIDALPDLARRGKGRTPVVPPVATAEREREAVAKVGGRFLALGQGLYPRALAELENAPPLLTVMGDVRLLDRPMIAIVGARNSSAAACRFARTLAHDLGREDVAVVSGLARGIDSAAHDGSLESGTIAVIAGGLDIYYPPENEARQKDIAERGLLIAEMPPGTEPHARHFPYRNRIIAGLSTGTVVVEAAPRSGSLITARLAAEAGREVMAVPGSPLDPRAQGCNQLIRDGATLIQNAADVMEAISTMSGKVASPIAGYIHDVVMPDGMNDSRDVDVTDSVRSVVESLLSPSPVSIDEIVRASGLSTSEIQLVLLEMDLAERIDRHAAGMVSLR